LSPRRIIEGGEDGEAILSLRGQVYTCLVLWESVSGHKAKKGPQVNRKAENDDSGKRKARKRRVGEEGEGVHEVSVFGPKRGPWTLANQLVFSLSRNPAELL
jgi:hypothetical protein